MDTPPSNSLPNSPNYNGGDADMYDADVSVAAIILLSLSSSSYPSPSTFSPPRNFPPLAKWSGTRKRSNFVDRQVVVPKLEPPPNLKVESPAPLIKEEVVVVPSNSKAELQSDLLVEEAMSKFEYLKFEKGKTLETALKDLKVIYKSNKEVVAGIESFEFLLSEGLDGDQMLDVLDVVCGVRKRKIDVKLEQQMEINSSPKKKKKKKKLIEESAKLKNLSELAGEIGGDDLKGSSINRTYECKECKDVFYSSQALGGHTASHNRKKRIEEVVLLQTRSDLTETTPAGGNGGGGGRGSGLVADGDQKNSVYKCNLCPKSFSTGQALGGHKTYHRQTDGIDQKKGSSGYQVMKIPIGFDINVSIDDPNSADQSMNVVREVSDFYRPTCVFYS